MHHHCYCRNSTRSHSHTHTLTFSFLFFVAGNSDDGKEWLNPSAAQIYRACKRKGKDVDMPDAARMAYIHEFITAESWDAVMEYEKLHFAKCPNPSLASFKGMDGIYSAKSRFFTKFFNAPLPYDRHDWTINRCGTDVNYIIDYYAAGDAAEEAAPAPAAAASSSSSSSSSSATAAAAAAPAVPVVEMESFFIDARPVATVSGLTDRARVAFGKWRLGQPIW
jgi:hypothetical protein